MKDWVIYQLARIVSAGLSLLPLSVALWLARQAGSLCYLVMAKRRKVALENIRTALGALSAAEQKKLARAAFQNVCLSVVELFNVEKFCSQARERFVLKGNEHTVQALAKGKGFVLVCSHVGSWELLAMTPFLSGQTWSVVVKDIRNPYLNKKIDALRRKMTLIPIPKEGAVREVIRRLRSNECVSILIDQWAGPEGLWLPFFGKETSTTSLPVRLARKTGCALVPAFCFREKDGRYTLQIEPAVEFDPAKPDWEEDTTLRLSRILEDKIRSRPEQWVWTHRRWKPKPHTVRSDTTFPKQY